VKILVTGATGLLGGNLVRHLLESGDYEIRTTIRERSNTMAIEGLDVQRVTGDVRDREAMKKAVAGCDAVIHAAASVSQWPPNLPMMKQVNVQGTVNVLEAALDAGVKRAVHVSTVDTLGLSSKETPADETCGHESMAVFKNPYVDTKYEAEKQAKRIAEKGLDLVIVKPTYMIGEWDVKPSSGQMIIQVAKGRAIGYPGGGNNFVDVLDVCRGIRLALQKAPTGESYILGNESGNLTYKEMWDIIAKIANVRPPMFRIPYPVALAAGYAMDLAGRTFRTEPDLNSTIARISYAPHYFTARKAIEHLGVPQSPIEKAVQRAYHWFRQKGFI